MCPLLTKASEYLFLDGQLDECHVSNNKKRQATLKGSQQVINMLQQTPHAHKP